MTINQKIQLSVINQKDRLSTRIKVSVIVFALSLLSLCLVVIIYIQADILNAVSSYIRGEGLWAKAQKEAVLHLYRFAENKQQTDFENYIQAIQVPLSAGQARVEMESDSPDHQFITEKLHAAQNDLEDIPGMIRFFLRFKNQSYLKEMRNYWKQGDLLIVQLQSIATRLKMAVNQQDEAMVSRALEELYLLNKNFTLVEMSFSKTLSVSARWIKQLLIILGLLFFASTLIIILIISLRLVKGIERKENQLLISENRFKSLYQFSLLGIFDWEKSGKIFDANQAFLNMIGYSQKELNSGKLNWRELTLQSGSERDEEAVREISEKGFCNPFEKVFIHKQGHKVPVYVGAGLFDGHSDKGICFVLDQSQSKQDEKELRLSATVFDASSNGIIITDQNFRVLKVNSAYSFMSGYSEDELLGSKPGILSGNNLSEPLLKTLKEALMGAGYWQADLVEVKKGGLESPVHLHVNRVDDQQGLTSHYVFIYTDISERKAAEAKLRQMAHYDYLTGLANRSLFKDLHEQALLRAKRNNTTLGLLFFDLDNFKPVNDTYGHDSGDKLLKAIAQRISNRVRVIDSIARLGGDEFVILLEELETPQKAADVAQKVIDAINQTFEIDSHRLRVGCSLGISIYPNDCDNADTMMRYADIAMYAAKAAGRNRYYFFNSNTGSNAK